MAKAVASRLARTKGPAVDGAPVEELSFDRTALAKQFRAIFSESGMTQLDGVTVGATVNFPI